MRRGYGLLLGVVLAGCGPSTPPPPETISTTYRVLVGVSMGGTGAGALGLLKPERFDGVAALGGPLDAHFFLGKMIDQSMLGGFCSLAELEAILAQDPVKLNDRATIDACSLPRRSAPVRWEHAQDFNHWRISSNGGTLDRTSHLNMMSDLMLAYGNFFSENPASPMAPPGIDPERLRHPPADACSAPVVLKNVYNAEYNPRGTYDVITFCDGEPQTYYCSGNMEQVDFCSDPANVIRPLPRSAELAFANAFCAGKGTPVAVNKRDTPLYFLDHGGAVDPCRLADMPSAAMLAVDMNRNGRRDYGEPVVNNGQERYDDVGADGCADATENGAGGCASTANPSAVDPNHDNYDAETNPLGTERNWGWDLGEPFRDHGLDGVANTHDFGEGNGVFDLSSGRRKLWAYDLRSNFAKLDEKGRKRLSIIGDGGIRDVMNLGVNAFHSLMGIKALRATPFGVYRDFTEIPNQLDRRTGLFNPWNAFWKLVPRDLITLFGKEQPTDQDRVEGEGDHVGTTTQALQRFYVAFNWAAVSWPSLERPATPLGGSTAEERQRVEWFQSAALKAKWEYAIALPPGYDNPVNADARYPVVYMLHGYGMDSQGFISTSLITDSYVTDKDVKFRPMIFVYPLGRCCWRGPAGERDCRQKDDSGVKIDSKPGWERECHSGTFWVNRSGYTPADGTAYGDAFFELMDHIDATYRTLPTAELESR